MTVTLRLLPEQFAEFQSALLEAAPRESVAIGFAGWVATDRGFLLTWRGFVLAPDDAYLRRGPGGAEVSPIFIAGGVKRARSSGEAVFICHTHPFSAHPSFSGIDDGGEDVLIPKIRDRVPDAPHGGLVVGSQGASVRVWLPGADRAIGAELRIFGSVEPGEPNAGFDRQERALGPGTTAALAKQTVAVIGAGGLGWDIATLLSAHGLGRLIVIDDDLVENHNLPRLRLAGPDELGLDKAEALRRLLLRARPDGQVVAVAEKLAHPDARAAIATADLVICATDNLASRLDADRLTKRLLVPLIDAGINVQVADNAVERVGGRVNVVWPTGPCLLCMGVFRPDDVAAEVDPLGYRNRGGRDEAAVASFNATLSGLVVSQALLLLLGAGDRTPSSRYLVYDGLEPRVREITVPAAGSCGTCAGLAGSLSGSVL